MTQSKVSLLPLPPSAQRELRSPEQLGLWPLKAKTIFPPNEARGAHYGGEVIADNGLRYFVKTQESGELLPFAELFSYELCRSLAVATPTHDRIEMPDGRIAFGTRLEGGEDGYQLAERIASDVAVHHCVGLQLSRLVAVDAFLPNHDRAFKNLRWLPTDAPDTRPPTQARGPIGALLALDFSRAFSAIGWPLSAVGFAMAPTSRSFYNLMKKQGLLEPREIGYALDRLANLPNGFIEMVLSKCAATWLTRQTSDAVVHWWTSPLRVIRVQDTERYLKDDLKISVLHS